MCWPGSLLWLIQEEAAAVIIRGKYADVEERRNNGSEKGEYSQKALGETFLSPQTLLLLGGEKNVQAQALYGLDDCIDTIAFFVIEQLIRKWLYRTDNGQPSPT